MSYHNWLHRKAAVLGTVKVTEGVRRPDVMGYIKCRKLIPKMTGCVMVAETNGLLECCHILSVSKQFQRDANTLPFHTRCLRKGKGVGLKQLFTNLKITEELAEKHQKPPTDDFLGIHEVVSEEHHNCLDSAAEEPCVVQSFEQAAKFWSDGGATHNALVSILRVSKKIWVQHFKSSRKHFPQQLMSTCYAAAGPFYPISRMVTHTIPSIYPIYHHYPDDKVDMSSSYRNLVRALGSVVQQGQVFWKSAKIYPEQHGLHKWH